MHRIREVGLEAFKDENVKKVKHNFEGDVMSILEKLACVQGFRRDVPNQKLAKELASKNSSEEISEIAENLWNKDKAIHSNCIKVCTKSDILNPN